MKVVLFIHGYGKSEKDWNLTDRGTPVNVQIQVAKVSPTILISLTREDYLKSCTEVINQIHLQCALYKYVMVVAHSQGAFYALKLAELYSQKYHKLLLLDPTAKTTEYLENLRVKDPERSCHFADLPTGQTLLCSVIVRVHLNIDPTSDLRSLEYWNRATNKNTKSRLTVHYGSSHMLHHHLAGTIIDSILELYKA